MRSLIRTTALTLALTFSAVPANAAEWTIDPTIELRTGYTDNLNLAIDDKISTTEVSLSPGAVFSVETPNSGASGNVNFNFRRFKEDSNLDDDNVRFDINTFHRMERSVTGLNASLIKDTTLDSQLEDTGFVFGRVDRRQLRGGPNWSYSLDERTTAQVNYSYTDVQYKNSGGTGFVDFTVHSGQTSLQRVLNERAMASLTLSYSRSDNDNKVESTNTNLQAGGSYQFSETLSGSLFAGIRRTETDFLRGGFEYILSGDTIIGIIPRTENVSDSSTGYTFNGDITKTFLRGETKLTASRNISSSTNGAPIEVTRLGWKSRYRLSQLLSAGLNVQFYTSQTDNTASRNLNRDYYWIEPRIDWHLKEFWKISGTYRYTKQTFDDTSDDATKNAAYLTLTYQWPRIAVSR